MSAATLSFRVMSMMGIVFAAAAGNFAVAALRIIRRRFVDVERLLGVLMRSARAALANARRRLG
jgi:hypothetical protein